jgi:hypothetical protein
MHPPLCLLTKLTRLERKGTEPLRASVQLRSVRSNSLTRDVSMHRYDSNSGGEREIQRTMLELLNQLDGFDTRGDVKVIMATNRIETLDPALIRPGTPGRDA